LLYEKELPLGSFFIAALLMTMDSLIRSSLVTSFVVLATASYLNAKLELGRAHSLSISEEEWTLPGPVLNFRTLSADIAWIRTLLLFGENKRHGIINSKSVLAAGRQIADFDSKFRDIYVFFPAMAMSGRGQLTEEELLEITHFLQEGVDRFPLDAEIPFSAAMNFVGYSDGVDRERRLREVERAIDLLRISISRDPEAIDTVNVLQWFLNRRVQLSGDQPNPLEQARIVEKLLPYINDPWIRFYLIEELKDLGVEPLVPDPAIFIVEQYLSRTLAEVVVMTNHE